MADDAGATTTLEDVMADFNQQWAGMLPTHPIEHLNKALADPVAKKEFAQLVATLLSEINPGFGKRCTETIDKERAMDLQFGCPGTTHVLAMSTDKVSRTTMRVFWRGYGSPKKLKDWLFKSLVQTLDTTVKKLKLCVAEELCGVPLSSKVFYAGYGSGNPPHDPWHPVWV